MLQLYCHDPSVCLRPLLSKHANVLLTGNILDPIDALAKSLDLDSAKVRRFTMGKEVRRFGPYIMTKGAD